MTLDEPLRHARLLSVMPTYQCTAACDHCGTLSHPRETTRLDGNRMLAAIEQAAQSGYDAIVFTGGEATLARRNLLHGIRRARSLGLPTRVVTNAFWARDEVSATKWIDELVRAGLNEINFSTGDQHARFVPVAHIVHATRAAVHAGLTVAIMIESVRERRVTKETFTSDPDYQTVLAAYPHARIKVLESPWMPLSSEEVGAYGSGVSTNRANLSLRGGCDSVLSTTTIQADGSIAACCGIGSRLIPELQLGNVADTDVAEADRIAADDFLKRWIRVEGPERILAWAATHDPSIARENMYAHRCQACIRMYKDPQVRHVIAEHHAEKIPDVLLAEYLMFHHAAVSSHKATRDVAETGGEGVAVAG